VGVKGETLCGCFSGVHVLTVVELPAAAELLAAMAGCNPDLSSL
jgi:hypothetical protein